MKRFKSIFLILLTVVISSYKQEIAEDEILWTKSKKLTWNDFKAVPDNNSKDGAITYSGFNYAPYKIKSSSDTVALNIQVYFLKNLSWVKDYAKTKEMLAHEQCHFDINELFARKFIQQISTCKFKRNTFKETLRQLLAKTEESRTVYQNNYDSETNHSKIAAKQIEWEKKVAKELKSLESFSKKNISIYISKQ